MTLRCKPVTAKEDTPLIIRPARPGIFFKVKIMKTVEINAAFDKITF